MWMGTSQPTLENSNAQALGLGCHERLAAYERNVFTAGYISSTLYRVPHDNVATG